MSKFQDCGCVVFTFIRQIMGCAENKHNKCYGAMLLVLEKIPSEGS